jgi:hypothetical protein
MLLCFWASVSGESRRRFKDKSFDPGLYAHVNFHYLKVLPAVVKALLLAAGWPWQEVKCSVWMTFAFHNQPGASRPEDL